MYFCLQTAISTFPVFHTSHTVQEMSWLIVCWSSSWLDSESCWELLHFAICLYLPSDYIPKNELFFSSCSKIIDCSWHFLPSQIYSRALQSGVCQWRWFFTQSVFLLVAPQPWFLQWGDFEAVEHTGNYISSEICPVKGRVVKTEARASHSARTGLGSHCLTQSMLGRAGLCLEAFALCSSSSVMRYKKFFSFISLLTSVCVWVYVGVHHLHHWQTSSPCELGHPLLPVGLSSASWWNPG